MKTDIEIARETKMLPIKDVAAQYGISEDDLELYGKYKAKISNELWNEVGERPDGKLVLVTAINPTPAGEERPPPASDWPRLSQKRERRPCWP